MRIFLKLDYQNETIIKELPIGLAYTFRVGIFENNNDILDTAAFWSMKSDEVNLSFSNYLDIL